VSSDLFKTWLEPNPMTEVRVYRERNGTRSLGLELLKKLLASHFVGEETVLKAGGYEKAVDVIKNSLPSDKKTRSGDLAELIATEYVNSETTFKVPINKLIWKSDRQMPMHGNDVVAIQTGGTRARILKGECKSRSHFSEGAVTEAVETLEKHDGRPNPSTLAFITKRLYEAGRDEEAKVFQQLQTAGALAPGDITHMIFTLCGNNPCDALKAIPKASNPAIKREGAAVTVTEHGDFIESVFKTYGPQS
jgi:hypothetical protein